MNDFHIDMAERIVKDSEKTKRSKLLNLMYEAEEADDLKKFLELSKAYTLLTR